ncbi:hypothetical protein RHGRI_023568 [Rhododendron griersonianum]|uniref:Uncharacterized protein n=1 Tax=Rhododendron griersonianum TaxID=479676 RepID=A0AAV6J4A4_9ERIC|nr:hypothetical protein RHGRI_023568 [Rhododendron griersonianum]
MFLLGMKTSGSSILIQRICPPEKPERDGALIHTCYHVQHMYSVFVEIMAPVFSRDAWHCVWRMIQVQNIIFTMTWSTAGVLILLFENGIFLSIILRLHRHHSLGVMIVAFHVVRYPQLVGGSYNLFWPLQDLPSRCLGVFVTLLQKARR